MLFTIDELKEKLKFLVNAYKVEANNETEDNANTINVDKDDSTNNANTNEFTDFDLANTNQNDDMLNLTNNDNLNLATDTATNDSKLTDENIREQLNLFLLLKRLRDIVFMYLRLKNLVFNQPTFLSKLDTEYINQFYELELILEYLLINFRTIELDVLNKYITKLEEQLNNLAIDIYNNMNKVNE